MAILSFFPLMLSPTLQLPQQQLQRQGQRQKQLSSPDGAKINKMMITLTATAVQQKGGIQRQTKDEVVTTIL